MLFKIQEADENTDIKTLPYMFDRLTYIVEYLVNKLGIAAQERENIEQGRTYIQDRNFYKDLTPEDDIKVKKTYNYGMMRVKAGRRALFLLPGQIIENIAQYFNDKNLVKCITCVNMDLASVSTALFNNKLIWRLYEGDSIDTTIPDVVAKSITDITFQIYHGVSCVPVNAIQDSRSR